MQSRNVKELQNCRYSAVTKLQTCRPKSKNLNVKLTLNICQLAQDPESRVHGIQSETALSKIKFHLKSTVLGTKKDNKTISLTKIISFYRCTVVLFMCSDFLRVFLNLLREGFNCCLADFVRKFSTLYLQYGRSRVQCV